MPVDLPNDAWFEQSAEHAPAPARPESAVIESELDAGFLSRQFGYTDGLAGPLHPYSVTALAFAGESRWYPAAHVTDGALANVGFVGRYELGVPPRTAEGLGARTRQFRLGLSARVPFETGRVLVTAQWGRHEFGVDPDPVLGPLVPDVRYDFGRVALGVHLDFLGRWFAELEVGTRTLFDAGPIAGPHWFPHADAGALDITLDAGYRLRPFEVVLGTRYERYFFSLNPDPGGENPGGIAAGAADAYVTVYAGLRFSLSRRGLSRQ